MGGPKPFTLERSFENVILAARRREHFWVFSVYFFCCWTPPKKEVFWNTGIHSLLVNWCRHSVELRALTRQVLSNKEIWMLSHWVDTPPIHTSEWDSLFFQGFLLSTVTVTLSDSDYVKRSASFQWFLSELTSFRLSQVTIEEYGVSKKWVMIMDKRQDKNSASTPAETLTSGPSAQDRYCARGSWGGVKKRNGNREGQRSV
jgi:hypothetical protein